MPVAKQAGNKLLYAGSNSAIGVLLTSPPVELSLARGASNNLTTDELLPLGAFTLR